MYNSPINIMKKQTFSIRFGIIILLIAFIHAQENRGALVGAWEFKSMTTIHYSEPKQVEIIYSGENNNETCDSTDPGTSINK